MLAQNFKTPTDLGLSDAEFESLLKVLGAMERGEIKPHQFNMEYWESPCRTAHCIGGWADHMSAGDVFDNLPTPAINELFYPECYQVGTVLVSGFKATTVQAASALRNYLTTGEPNWAEALS